MSLLLLPVLLLPLLLLALLLLPLLLLPLLLQPLIVLSLLLLLLSWCAQLAVGHNVTKLLHASMQHLDQTKSWTNLSSSNSHPTGLSSSHV